MDKNFKERLQSIKESPKTKCTFMDENDREGYTYDITDNDLAWLMSEIVTYKRLAESYERIAEGFISDTEDLKARLIKIRNDLSNNSLQDANNSLNYIIDFLLVNFDKNNGQANEIH